ncbi:methyltransferase family protein [Nocardia sp. NPDC059240]|uniref:methyltransferase family protein n=1 Tax=Nocardia sp. NPDC059240 TaxID=3346786 RepID=UPI0036BFF328
MDAVDALVRVALWSSQLVWVVWLITAVWFSAVRQDSLGGKVKHFFGTLLPEPWMLVGIVILVVAMSFVPRRVWDPVLWDVRPMSALGAVVIIAGSVLMVWARLALGTMWAGRPMIQEEHELRTGGPYRLVRHPIYTGLLALVGGAALLQGGPSLVIFAFVLVWLLRRVRVEDRMLIATFGQRYEEYRNAVPALLPLAKR